MAVTQAFEIRVESAAVTSFLGTATKEVRNALKSATRRALAVMRSYVRKAAPTARFKLSKSYTISAKPIGANGIKGKLSAKRGAALIQTGAKEHFAKVTAGMVAWMTQHGYGACLQRKGLRVNRGGKHYVAFEQSPSLLAWATAHGILQKQYIKRKAMPARPWVRAAAQAGESAASTAFEDSIDRAIQKAGGA